MTDGVWMSRTVIRGLARCLKSGVRCPKRHLAKQYRNNELNGNDLKLQDKIRKSCYEYLTTCRIVTLWCLCVGKLARSEWNKYWLVLLLRKLPLLTQILGGSVKHPECLFTGCLRRWGCPLSIHKPHYLPEQMRRASCPSNLVLGTSKTEIPPWQEITNEGPACEIRETGPGSGGESTEG